MDPIVIIIGLVVIVSIVIWLSFRKTEEVPPSLASVQEEVAEVVPEIIEEVTPVVKKKVAKKKAAKKKSTKKRK